MTQAKKVLAPAHLETKTPPNYLGCLNFNQYRSATFPWIHVYEAALSAIGKNLC